MCGSRPLSRTQGQRLVAHINSSRGALGRLWCLGLRPNVSARFAAIVRVPTRRRCMRQDVGARRSASWTRHAFGRTWFHYIAPGRSAISAGCARFRRPLRGERRHGQTIGAFAHRQFKATHRASIHHAGSRCVFLVPVGDLRHTSGTAPSPRHGHLHRCLQGKAGTTLRLTAEPTARRYIAHWHAA